jgi:hypothetical protein
MSYILPSFASRVRSLNDVSQLCLALTAACFVVGAILLIANIFLPLGARGAGLFAVGCFYLCHGIAEGLRKRDSKNKGRSSDGNIWPWEQRRDDDPADSSGEASGSLAA